MALIPQEPKQRSALLVGLAAVAAFYLFNTFWYAPKVVENELALERLEFLESQNRRSRVLLAQGGANLEERLALYERHISRLEQLIPQREEVASLLLQITDEGRQNDVVLRNFSPQQPGEPTAEPYDRLSYSLEVVGEYHDVGRFLSSVASLPRIMTAVGMTLNPLNTDEETHPDILGMTAPVEATFQIQTYVLKVLAPPVLGEEEMSGGDR